MRKIGEKMSRCVGDIIIGQPPYKGDWFREETIWGKRCRNFLANIAEGYSQSNKIILMPAYTCWDSVVRTFEDRHWKCYFYGIHTTLRIDIENLLALTKIYTPCLILVHPYYGMELNKEELSAFAYCVSQGATLIKDITQGIYTERREKCFRYTTGSLRKWLPISEGAILEDNTMKYFAEIPEQIQKYNPAYDSKKRIQNFWTLFQGLKDYSNCIPAIDANQISTPPLYFPVYANKRMYLQEYLMKNNIISSALWKIYDESVLLNEEVKFIYDHILALHIDQRYGGKEMNTILHYIFRYYNT